jgi:hypothetical protein
MDDTDPAKLEAALEQLEIEKERRRQAKIDAGEMVSIQTVVVLHPDEDEEEAIARAIAMYPAPDDGREVHREFFYVSTGVPRPDPDEPAPQVQTARKKGPRISPPRNLGAGLPPAPSQPMCE